MTADSGRRLTNSIFFSEELNVGQDLLSPSPAGNYFHTPNCMTRRYDFIAMATLLLNPCPTQDCQSQSISRFSYSSENNNVVCPTTASLHGARPFITKKARRRQKRKGKKKVVERRPEKQRPRQRTPSGVPEQESGCSPIQVTERRPRPHFVYGGIHGCYWVIFNIFF